MGRNAQPVEIIKARGKSNHLTKKEIEIRKENEIKLGIADLKKIKPPEYIKNNKESLKIWKYHIKQYKEALEKGIEILSYADIDIFATYCNYQAEFEWLNEELEEAKKIPHLKNIITYKKLINENTKIRISLQDKLFLNPLARIKNVPKREKQKELNEAEKEFDI